MKTMQFLQKTNGMWEEVDEEVVLDICRNATYIFYDGEVISAREPWSKGDDCGLTFTTFKFEDCTIPAVEKWFRLNVPKPIVTPWSSN